jgi:DNA polymerase-3 subunit alpha
VHEARMHGATVEPPCINTSEAKTIIEGKTIYLGFSMLKSLETKTIAILLADRYRNGPFNNLRDFLKRVSISLEQLSILIRIDAFRFTGKSKKELIWDAHFLLSKAKKTRPINTLFYEAAKEFVIPPLYAHALESAYDEIELVGFPIGISPFKLVEINDDKYSPTRKLPYMINKRVEVIGYLIHAKRTRTTNGKQMTFGTFIDREGNWIDTVQFPEVTANYPFRGPGCYKIKGKVISEFGFISIETSELYRIPTINIEEPSTRLKLNSEQLVS